MCLYMSEYFFVFWNVCLEIDWVCAWFMCAACSRTKSMHHNSNWLSSLHQGVTAVMVAAVITHCSNGVYDKARHYRAAEYLSKLRILSQTVSGSRSMATWQHWNGVDSKSAYASKTAHLPVVVARCGLVLLSTRSFTEALSSLGKCSSISYAIQYE